MALRMVCACLCVCVRLCVSMHISQQKGYKIMSQEHLWVKKFLSSARVQNGGKKDTLGATIVNSASQFDFANNTQTNWQHELNNRAVNVTAAVLRNMIICCHQYLEISWPSLIMPDINYTMYLWKAHNFFALFTLLSFCYSAWWLICMLLLVVIVQWNVTVLTMC